MSGLSQSWLSENAQPEFAPCRLRIDHGALARNWQAMDAKTGHAKTAACVKADAYGLGASMVASTLKDAGCDTFFVATIGEGVALREQITGSRIFIFGGLNSGNAQLYSAHNLLPVLNSSTDIDVWLTHQNQTQAKLPAALFIDTGMNRLGLNETELSSLVSNADTMSALNICTVLTHLSCAEEEDQNMNERQLALFTKLSNHFPAAEKSLANSAGAFLGNGFQFDLVRAGIALYGAECGPDNALEPVVTAQARILQIRNVKKGESVGYGNCHVFERDSVIATAGVGYADGYNRSGSGSGVPLRGDGSSGARGFIGGYEVPVLGRISMDYTSFDLSDVPDEILRQHEWIELFGKNLPIDRVARAGGTIGYEMLTSLGARYHREHLNMGTQA